MNIRRSTVLAMGLAALVFLQTPAQAAPQWCTGSVLSSWTNIAGDVLISGSWRGDHTQICNLKQEWKGVTPDICMGWVAKLDAAAALNKSVTIQYNDASSCASLPIYGQTPSPAYVMLNNS